MKLINDITFILTHLSTIAAIAMVFIVLRFKKKSQLQRVFFIMILSLLLWNIGTLLEIYVRKICNYTDMLFVNISYIGICFLPIFILLFGIVFAKTEIKLSWKYYFLFLVPIVSTVIIWTNSYHRLFFKVYSVYSREAVYGPYYYFHSIYSYLCILAGIAFLYYFSIKNAGFFSRQSIMIILSIIAPLSINIIYSFNLAELTFSVNSVAFTLSIMLCAIAIFRYKFLSVIPIARERVVALISDSYIVIDKEMDVIDYNNTFSDTFKDVIKPSRNISLKQLLEDYSTIDLGLQKIIELNSESIRQKKSFDFERHVVGDNFDKYFKIEITPIFIKNNYIGSIILLKDITQSVKNLETIKEKQAILLEQERLASLGQLAGGIAHNLRTPIMSIAGGIEALKDLVKEYRDSINDEEVTPEDHLDIASEMNQWLDKMKPYCTYMSDIIAAVKGQAVQMNASMSNKFTVDELVKRVDMLMKHELKKYHCLLNLKSNIDMNTEIKGDVNNLVQVFDNIIINAIHAYEGNNGIIDFEIVRSGDNVEFTFKDYAKGIPKSVSDRLFKEMITTKGKNGTGLGLYMSYSTIKGRFGGTIFFTSKEGQGTTFYITIPCITYVNQEEA